VPTNILPSQAAFTLLETQGKESLIKVDEKNIQLKFRGISTKHTSLMLEPWE
jgi:hypothetical protein